MLLQLFSQPPGRLFVFLNVRGVPITHITDQQYSLSLFHDPGIALFPAPTIPPALLAREGENEESVPSAIEETQCHLQGPASRLFAAIHQYKMLLYHHHR